MSGSDSIRALKTSEDLEDLLARSVSSPVVILKHSTRCPISTHAHGEFNEYAASATGRGVVCAVVLVVEDRPLSLEIAERLGVPHQSPQAILVRDGDAVWNDSHERVSALALQQAEG